ncbi:hypothetical protein [Rhizobium grahamii]|uniref:Uncharacterized protein n=1 Tax=Rhizobium grahamii CCGE 502 TaxID=990285 RepID=S3HLP9_9HYPH|nr:hypothetical protein [Rhizobium grahamii]EPE99529.1 hypothetical protein RGCCGE502_05080 [Rhizobium grahamii CCGE 502]
MKTYTVLRQHLGDKMYMPGDERQATEGDVTHLIRNGVLEEKKSEKRVVNKAAPPVKNKSE